MAALSDKNLESNLEHNPQAITEQQAFKLCATHLLTQSKHSVSPENEDICSYRGANGMKCAAGIFISDDEYREEMEDKNWHSVVGNYDLLVGKNNKRLISVMQEIHDTELVEDWKDCLMSLGNNVSLDVDFLDDYCWDVEEGRYLLREKV